MKPYDEYTQEDWDNLTGRTVCRILRWSPEYVDRCDLTKLDGDDWSTLVVSQPTLVDVCAWDKLNGFDFAWMVSSEPCLAEYCRWKKLDDDDWSWLLKDNRRYADIGVRYYSGAIFYIDEPTEEQQRLHDMLWEI